VDPTADLLVKLHSIDKPRLRQLWQDSFNRPPSPRLRRELMLPILAFRNTRAVSRRVDCTNAHEARGSNWNVEHFQP
jgi:hypothetical protein